MSSVFGKAKFGGNKRTWFKLKDGDSVFRILPPMGDLQEDGIWSQYLKIHYGYKNSKGEMRTFQSPEVKNMKTGMIEVEDPALTRINQLLAKLAQAKEAGNKAEVTELLKLVGGQKSRFNLDANHYLNVIDLQGTIGILKIRHRAKQALDATIKKLRAEGVEPLDPETGRFFVFSRSGQGRETLYTVSVYKQKLNVEGVGMVERDVVHTITDDIARRCVVLNKNGKFEYKEAADLTRLFKKPTSEQVARFVKEGPTAIDEILDAKTASNEAAIEDDSGSEDDEPTVQASVRTLQNVGTANSVPISKLLETAPVTVQTGSTGAAIGQQTTPAPTVTPVSAPKTTAETVTQQSDEDFLKSLGI